MKSEGNSSLHVQRNEKTPLSKRRLKTKPTLLLIAVLLLGNFLWFIAWLIPNEKDASKEQVAAVDGEIISRQQWMAAMEQQYGQETLKELINAAVMNAAADKYDIEVNEKEIDFEIAFMRSAQDTNDTSLQNLSTEELRDKVRSQLILEKVLSKDIVVSNDEVETYYNDNKSLYNIPDTYKTKLIEVSSKDEAKSVIEELKDGSDFSVLARERSLNTTSASLGGSIGFISNGQENMDSAIVQIASELREDEISDAFQLSNGNYAVIVVEEYLEGQAFSFDEVKDHIKRFLAIEQLPMSLSAETFWSEFDAEWIYENKN